MFGEEVSSQEPVVSGHGRCILRRVLSLTPGY